MRLDLNYSDEVIEIDLEQDHIAKIVFEYEPRHTNEVRIIRM